MATPNYGYEKRQRELAKKQKKEEKLRAKAGRKQEDSVATDSDHDTNAQVSDPDGASDAPSSSA